MSSIVTALTATETGISSAKLWTEVSGAVPFIAIIFMFAFGYRVLRHVLVAGSKGKVNL